MNILIGSNVHWWNAEAAYAATLAELLQQAGHNVFVLTVPDSLNAQKLQEKELTLVTHIDLNTQNPLHLVQSYQALKSFVIEKQIEIVNPHRSEGFPLYVLLSWQLKSFKLIRTRGTTRPVQKHFLNQKLHRDWTDSHIVAGHIVAERLLAGGNVAPEKLHRIYYPVQITESPESPKDYAEEFQISEDALTLAIVGRLSPVKGHSFLLKSFSELLKQFPHLVLLILYRDATESSEDLIALKQEIEHLDLNSQIRLIPPHDEIRQIMKFVDIGIVSSLDSEVICRVAVEFFSAGTPVVAFPTGCLPEIVQDGRNGKLCSTHSVEALTAAISELIEDKALRQKLGQNALVDAATRFAPERLLKQTLNVFRQ